MITPLDIACVQIIQAADRVHEAHYHIANPPQPQPRTLLEESIFHLVDRNIHMAQIGFDYYSNVVTYRV